MLRVDVAMNKKRLKQLEEMIAAQPCGCFVFSCLGDISDLDNHDMQIFSNPTEAQQLYDAIQRQGLPCAWGSYAISEEHYFLHPFDGKTFFVVAMQLFIAGGFLSIKKSRQEVFDEVSRLFCDFAEAQDDDGWVS